MKKIEKSIIESIKKKSLTHKWKKLTTDVKDNLGKLKCLLLFKDLLQVTEKNVGQLVSYQTSRQQKGYQSSI